MQGVEFAASHGDYLVPTRFTRIEFPKFDGEDLIGWIYKCEQFFVVDGTPPKARMKLASIHLEVRPCSGIRLISKVRTMSLRLAGRSILKP